MEITINGKAADVTLENEKNVGEVVASLEQWLSGLGHRLSAMSIDGKALPPSGLEDSFSRDIKSIKLLELKTSSIAQLTAESLINILSDIKEYEKINFKDKTDFLDNWKQSAQAVYTCENMTDLYNVLLNTFSGGTLGPQAVFSITEERLREVRDPQNELEKLKPLLDEVCARLTDLSLDVQTGKDLRAAQTIQLFSGVTEKMLRIANQLVIQGYLKQPIDQVIEELGNLIKELLDAYERHDTVLVGDIAEYEAVGKLQELYTALRV